MSRTRLLAAIVLAAAPLLHAQTAPDGAELSRLLNDFLAGASVNDIAAHERFWADDLIYTGSAGRRIGKPDILRDVRAASAAKTQEPPTVYSAEDVRIQQYGNTAVVAFRLIGTTRAGDKAGASKYWNTGTFVKRDGRWQAVSWQATKIPVSEERDTQGAAASPAGPKAAIVELGKAWERRFEAHDAAGLAALYTEDCVRMPDGSPVTIGRRPLERAYREEFEPLWREDAREQITTEEVVVAGDYAFARGSDTLTRSVAGNTARETGKWMATYRREPDGSWKFFWSTFNSDHAQETRHRER